jgi:hypothetical protein
MFEDYPEPGIEADDKRCNVVNGGQTYRSNLRQLDPEAGNDRPVYIAAT